MLKKIAVLGVLLSAGTGVNALASAEVGTENVGVSTQIPEPVLERGQAKPSTVWNVKSQGKYKFSGQTARHDLYTNYLFTGDTWYTVSVKNLKSSLDTDLKVQAYKQVTFASDPKIGNTEVIQGQKTKTYELTGLSSSDKIYLKIMAPAHFEGSIQ